MYKIRSLLVLLLGGVTMNASAAPEYVSIEMQIDINKPAETVWAMVGDYCDIAEWGNLPCEITAGDENGWGSVRTLLGGAINEVLIAKTALSYGYTAEPREGQPYDLYHGFMEARPLTATTSRMLYTLVFDVSNLEDEAAKEADISRRRNLFEGLLVNMKEIAEAQ